MHFCWSPKTVELTDLVITVGNNESVVAAIYLDQSDHLSET